MADLGVGGAGLWVVVGGALAVLTVERIAGLGAGEANSEDGVMNIDFVPSMRRPPKGGTPLDVGVCRPGVPERENCDVALVGVDGPAPGD